MIKNIKSQYSILKNFFVLEGIDGSGTTTQLNRVADLLLKNNIKIYKTYEPTRNKIGSFLRECLSSHLDLSERTYALLFAADRQEHVFGKNEIAEKLDQGNIVLCDRYLFSSLAYQGNKNDMDFVSSINSYFPLPEAVFFIDIDEKTALKRVASRAQKKDIFEEESFLLKVRKSYRTIFEHYKHNTDMEVIYINGNSEISNITNKIFNFIIKKIDKQMNE
ncbi:dTMP kinase [Spirochaetia bacterium 38H-sp]|uniref:Thymidylate kinase n=1 Tax=Rarispira pelagica TaxID=3141764 RepID=A0ABU9UAU2_9SPIR